MPLLQLPGPPLGNAQRLLPCERAYQTGYLSAQHQSAGPMASADDFDYATRRLRPEPRRPSPKQR